MKLIKQKQAELFDKGTTKILEYHINDKDINFGVAEINGRYPEKGLVFNEKCKELAYVLEGIGSINVNGKVYNFEKGDCILINAGEKYFWEGKFTIAMPCTPAWYPEQHKLVE